MCALFHARGWSISVGVVERIQLRVVRLVDRAMPTSREHIEMLRHEPNVSRENAASAHITTMGMATAKALL